MGTVDPTQGDLRRTNVFIAGATSFPNAQKVPALVASLAGELRERMPAAATLREQLELAFEAHQRLVSIHPFNDGNGRTFRLLINYVQRYYGQPLTIVFREDRQAYFEALEQSRVAADLTLFSAFMRGQHSKSLAYQLSAATRSVANVTCLRLAGQEMPPVEKLSGVLLPIVSFCKKTPRLGWQVTANSLIGELKFPPKNGV